MSSSEWKRIQRGVPPFGLILKLQHWRFGNVFKLSSSLSTWFCTWMNLPNVARYGREISNVHQCHLHAVINVAISIKYYFNKILITRAWSVCTENMLPSVFAQTSGKISLLTYNDESLTRFRDFAVKTQKSLETPPESPHVRESGIRNPVNFCCWNPESRD